MPSEPSLTVAGPRVPAGGAVEPSLDGLVSAVPNVSLTWGPDGHCIEASVPADVGGDLTKELSGHRWLDLIHAVDRSRAAGLLASVLGGEPSRDEGVRLRGNDHWALLRVQADAEGGATGVLVEASHALGDSTRLARIVGSFNRLREPTDIVYAVLDECMAMLGATTGSVHVLNDTGDRLDLAGLRGYPPGAEDMPEASLDLDAAYPVTEVLRTADVVVIASEADRHRRYPALTDSDVPLDPTLVVVPLDDGEHHPFGALAIGFADGRLLRQAEHELLLDLAAQCALALDRARLTAIAEHRQERLTFLDTLNETLSRSLELEGTLNRLASLMVPDLADWCAVRLVSGPAEPVSVVGAAHVEPELAEEIVRLVHRLPLTSAGPDAPGAGLDAGRQVLGPEALDAFAALLGEEERPVLEAIGLDTLVLFPLSARDRLLGGLAFGYRPGRPFTAADAELADVVATRAAPLVDNARLFDERSVVADALQRSLLPASLPRIPGLELGAHYRAAGQGLEVGGDFYDAFHADDNWWVVAVGDVAGHGVEAAALTGLVRHTIRASAMAGAMPSAILGRLNTMLLQHSAELADVGEAEGPFTPRFCTVVVGAVKPTPEGVDIVLCLGGHPHPLVRRVDGRVVPTGVSGTLLGVTDRVSLVDSVVHLDPGEALVCFTDGLTDRRRDFTPFGEEGLVAAVEDASRMKAQEIATHIVGRAVGYASDEPTDDMAVLALVANPG
jgi:serine phosphatase RsbU (regulator of sigma subunit)